MTNLHEVLAEVDRYIDAELRERLDEGIAKLRSEEYTNGLRHGYDDAKRVYRSGGVRS